MKNPLLAFTLNFFFPGAGLAYLGKWRWGFINLGCVLLIGVILAFALPDDLFSTYSNIIAAGLGGGSGGLAQSLATQRNQKIKRNEEKA